MKTLAEQFPEGVEWFRACNSPGYAEMMGHFHTFPEMNSALGLSQSSVRNAMRDKSKPQRQNEERAVAWLKSHAEVVTITENKSPDGMFLVACPTDKEAKARRVLALMGCEVVDI